MYMNNALTLWLWCALLLFPEGSNTLPGSAVRSVVRRCGSLLPVVIILNQVSLHGLIEQSYQCQSKILAYK